MPVKRTSKPASKARTATRASSKRASKSTAPRRRSPEPAPEISPERLQFLTEREAHYEYIFQKNAYVIGPETTRQEAEPIHDEAAVEFFADPSNPLILPRRGDLEAETALFARCDEISKIQPTRLHDFFFINFAAWAGLQHLLERSCQRSLLRRL
ncbi:hypothetical protein B0H21DRAFT_818227 [Amylocystis lapponica]|nr:hypothetical protein B0H21DRAFT_818227 [Amylocystis lapponica]